MPTLLNVTKNLNGNISVPFSYLDFMADCVIILDQRIWKQVTTKRLQVTKYRGSGYLENENPFFISSTGIHVQPVADVSMRYEHEPERVSSGNPSLDAILGGGYNAGTCILVSGLTGTGKTALASMFAHSACRREQKVLYVTYEEAQKSLVAGMLSLGIDLRPAMGSSMLNLMSIMPESMGVEKHLFTVIRTLKKHQSRHLIVDAISASKRIAGQEAAFDFIMRIVDACKKAGVTAFLLNQAETQSDLSHFSGLGVSSLVDTIINLEYKDTDSEFLRRLMVVKSRGSRHSHRYHEYKLTGQGLEIDADPV